MRQVCVTILINSVTIHFYVKNNTNNKILIKVSSLSVLIKKNIIHAIFFLFLNAELLFYWQFVRQPRLYYCDTCCVSESLKYCDKIVFVISPTPSVRNIDSIMMYKVGTGDPQQSVKDIQGSALYSQQFQLVQF